MDEVKQNNQNYIFTLHAPLDKPYDILTLNKDGTQMIHQTEAKKNIVCETCFKEDAYLKKKEFKGHLIKDKYDNDIFIVYEDNSGQYDNVVTFFDTYFTHDIFRNSIIIELARPFTLHQIQECIEEWIPNYSYATYGLKYGHKKIESIYIP